MREALEGSGNTTKNFVFLYSSPMLFVNLSYIYIVKVNLYEILMSIDHNQVSFFSNFKMIFTLLSRICNPLRYILHPN